VRHLYDKIFAASLFVIATDRPITLLELLPGLTETAPGEFHGPCPFCEEGDDRFMVWPAEEPSWGGRYYCRQCGKTGNGIVFLRQFHGWPFQTARDLFLEKPRKTSAAPLRTQPTQETTTTTASPQYIAYMQSMVWKDRRGIALTVAGYHCRRCFASRDLDVYHRTYARLFHEEPEDLIVLCRGCQEKEPLPTHEPSGQ
jgi:RNase P subunit RPR2